MAEVICHSCTRSMGDEVALECKGFCNAIFHFKCAGVSEDKYKEMTATNQWFWLCKSCSNLMRDMRFRRSVKSSNEVGLCHQPFDQNKVVEQLKKEVIGPLKEEIKHHFSRLINSSALTPKSSRRHPARQKRFKPRRVINDQRPGGAELAQGEDGDEEEIPTVPVRNSTPKFWLYLARISNDVTAEQVAAFARNRLGTSDVVVYRLVARGRDVSTMRHISFKVGVSEELRTKALSAATWPRGVYFREFEDRTVTSEDFASPLLSEKSPGSNSENLEETPLRQSSGGACQLGSTSMTL